MSISHYAADVPIIIERRAIDTHTTPYNALQSLLPFTSIV